MQRNREKQQNGKNQRSLQENQTYQGNISHKDGHNKGQKQYRSNRSRRYEKEVARIHRRTIQKGPKDADIHDGVIPHLEPDILDCKVKWALGSITMNKASGSDGIPAGYFKS